ncbi:MAG: hypothetical protein ACOX5A_05805 [Aminivibrio sp.]
MTCRTTAPQDWRAELVENRKLDDASFLLSLDCTEIARAAEPGQFVLLRPGAGNDPFLGRPLAVAAVDGDVFTVLLRVTGRGTEMLASRREGDVITVRGPSGRGFWSSRKGEPLPGKIILAGGSVGAAPLIFAAGRLGSAVTAAAFGFAGRGWEGTAKLAGELVSGAGLFSDDGAFGRKGTVLAGLPDELPHDAEIWACGPVGMLRALAAKYPGSGSRVRVSLEARMACGAGGCLGCVIPLVTGNARVCADGPVFKAGEVKWDDLDQI